MQSQDPQIPSTENMHAKPKLINLVTTYLVITKATVLLSLADININSSIHVMISYNYLLLHGMH